MGDCDFNTAALFRLRHIDEQARAIHSNGRASVKRPRCPGSLPPFSLRLSEEERAQLLARAGALPLGAYIRQQLFGQTAALPRRRIRLPLKDHEALARVLATLGSTELSASLRDMAAAAKRGALPISPETEEQLVQACAAIREMRTELLRALGHRITE